MADSTHQTVLLREAVEALMIDPEGWYMDGTFGRGGHSRAILARLAPAGRLLAVDKDPQAIAAGSELAAQDNRFCIARGSFADLPQLLAEQGWQRPLSGLLLDLGVSSPQLDQPERGFSFLRDGYLDMRMDPEQGISAAEWLAQAPEAEIARVFKDYGEERFAKRMARAVVAARREAPIESTAVLAKILTDANPAWERDKHPATRAFQGLRIFINNELGDLETLLQRVLDVLAVGGRLVVISFHSLEDRLVKRFIQRESRGHSAPAYIPITESERHQRLRAVGKAVRASAEEVAANPRARSAIMRVAERVA